MKFTQVLLSVVAIGFLSACSSSTNTVAEGSAASTTEAPAAQVAAAEPARDDGYRCERRQVTGTRLTQKYCTTRKQREDIARAASTAAGNITRRATQAGGPAAN